MIRAFEERDAAALRQIHAENDYGFPFPCLEAMRIGFVIEEGGKVLGYVGAEFHAELTGIFKQKGSPHERMRIFARLHRPMAEALADQGIKSAFVSLDPQFKAFSRRLLSLGWRESLWKHMFLEVKECLKLYRKAA